MTIRATVLFTAALLFTAFSATVPASAANLGNPASLNEKAPNVYKAKFDTSKGTFVIEVHREWAPNGADRFYNLVKSGFYNDARFFRVIDGFMVQFGISGNPDLRAAYPGLRVYATGAIDGALGGFLAQSAKDAVAYVDDPQLPAAASRRRVALHDPQLP